MGVGTRSCPGFRPALRTCSVDSGQTGCSQETVMSCSLNSFPSPLGPHFFQAICHYISVVVHLYPPSPVEPRLPLLSGVTMG